MVKKQQVETRTRGTVVALELSGEGVDGLVVYPERHTKARMHVIKIMHLLSRSLGGYTFWNFTLTARKGKSSYAYWKERLHGCWIRLVQAAHIIPEKTLQKRQIFPSADSRDQYINSHSEGARTILTMFKNDSTDLVFAVPNSTNLSQRYHFNFFKPVLYLKSVEGCGANERAGGGQDTTDLAFSISDSMRYPRHVILLQ
ncbi:hypothetical protein EDC04DRAFT_2956117 [Pisolithus marmoratus]|nr:hypothetical protein EDC04DRAFT_2956117 [Pisolithus marmoratus]